MTADPQIGHDAEDQQAAHQRAEALPVAIRLAQADDLEHVLALHREAFADKFRGAFGQHGMERGVAVLALVWQRQGAAALRGVFVAEQHGTVVGTATMRTWEMGSDDGGVAEQIFRQQLGFWPMLRALLAFSLLDHQIERREGFVTSVAVAANQRRTGVARALLTHIEHEARVRGKRFLGLYVSAENRGALRLYQSLGFQEVRLQRSLMSRFLFGAGRWIYMRKDLR